MKNLCGSPVDGDDFIFREGELSLIISALTEGNSVLLLGLRKLGKSSVLRETKRRLETESDAKCLLINMETMERPSDLFLAIISALPKSKKEQFKTYFARSRRIPSELRNTVIGWFTKGGFSGVSVELDKEVRDYWNPLSDAIDQLIETDVENRPILLLDELPLFLLNLLDRGYDASHMRLILGTLKSWREKGLAMACCGSINLDAVLDDKQVSKSVLGGLIRVELKPFSEAEIRELLSKVMKTRKWWRDHHADIVLEHVPDCIPYFHQLAAQYLRSQFPNEAGPSNDEVANVVREDVVRQITKAFLYQFDERIKASRYDPPVMRQSAKLLLNRLAKEPGDIVSEATALKWLKGMDVDGNALLSQLVMDEFLWENNQSQFQFSLEILRRWWLRRGDEL